MHPEEVSTSQLLPGQVGYIACNMKQSSEGEFRPFASFACPLSVTYSTYQPILVTRFIEWARWLNQCLGFDLRKLWYVQSTYPFFTLLTMSKVYAGVFPIDGNDFAKLEESIKRVCMLWHALFTEADCHLAYAYWPQCDRATRVFISIRSRL